jgi:hypothetical protein
MFVLLPPFNLCWILDELSLFIHASFMFSQVKFALISYRDHPPQDKTYVVKTSPWTSSVKKMKEYVDAMAADGGGDSPEAVVDSLEAARNLDYRKNSTRIVVLIADAPPHGLGEGGDGFDNGCPCGHDPLKVARLMSEMDIVIYAVAVEPLLGSSLYGRDFMMALAQITDGQCIPLTNATLLTKAIVGSAVEELSLARHQKAIEERVQKLQAEHPDWSEEKTIDVATEQLGAEGSIVTHQLDFGDVYANYNMKNVDILKEAKDLADARKKGLTSGLNTHINQKTSAAAGSRSSSRSSALSFAPRRSRAAVYDDDADEAMSEEECAAPSASARSEAVQSVEYSSKSVSRGQVARVWEKSKKKASRYSEGL